MIMADKRDHDHTRRRFEGERQRFAERLGYVEGYVAALRDQATDLGYPTEKFDTVIALLKEIGQDTSRRH